MRVETTLQGLGSGLNTESTVHEPLSALRTPPTRQGFKGSKKKAFPNLAVSCPDGVGEF